MEDPEGKRLANGSSVTEQLAEMSESSDEEADGIVSVNLFDNTMEGLREAARGRHGNSAEWRQRPIICSVPDELKRRNAVQQADEYQGYKPVAVRITPYGMFYDYTDLGSAVEKMEIYKWGCLQQLINQHSSHLQEPARTPALLLACLARMMRIMPQTMASYGISDSDSRWTDTIKRDMMAIEILLGGCFMLHRLLKSLVLVRMNQLDEEHEWAWQFVARDLLLLQNQIPFFFVRELFHQFINDNNTELRLQEHLVNVALVNGGRRLFYSFCPELLHSYHHSSDSVHIARVHHLLHLFHLFVVHKRGPSTTGSWHQYDLLPAHWIPSAKVLDDSGVRFRRRNGAQSFLDIRFDVRHGILAIPPLQLCDYSDALFRNLIAFEQTCPDIGHEISAYAIFMDCLIKTPEDMRILNLHGIIMSKISGDQNDSGFFSRISAHVPMPADNYLAVLMNVVSKNKDYRRRKWYSQLVRNYCSNPWVAMSVFAAVLLLCLTVLQTFFTVYPYYNPRG